MLHPLFTPQLYNILIRAWYNPDSRLPFAINIDLASNLGLREKPQTGLFINNCPRDIKRNGQLADAIIDSLVKTVKIGRYIKFGLAAASRFNCLSVWLRPWKSFRNMFIVRAGCLVWDNYLVVLRHE